MRNPATTLRPAGMPVFLLIWCGQLLSLLGSGLTEFALGVWIYQRTGSATQFALTFLFLTLPRILLSPFAGALVDRWDRRWTMILSDLGSGSATLAIAALLWSDRLELWHIYLLTAVSSVCGTFQGPAYAASIMLLVPPEHYGRANGLAQVAQSAAALLAPTFAGFLLLAIGIENILLIDVATFLCAIATLLLVRFPSVPRSSAEESPPTLLRDTIAGFRYLAQRPGLLGLLVAFAGANFFGLTAEVLLAPYVLSFASPAVLGIIASANGAGLLVGGLMLTAWGGPRRLIYGILGFELLVSLCTIAIGLAASPWSVGAAAFVYFAAIALGDGCSQTFWQRNVAPDFQGRVFALRQMITFATFPLGVVIIAPMAEYVFEPLLATNGPWAGSVGQLIGTGPSRGFALVFILAGIASLVIIALAYSYRPIRHAEETTDDGR